MDGFLSRTWQEANHEWILLTNVPTRDSEEAWTRGKWHECRWVLEEYHKAKKTGCGVEDLQFASSQALKPMIASDSFFGVAGWIYNKWSMAPSSSATKFAGTLKIGSHTGAKHDAFKGSTLTSDPLVA